MPPAPSSTLAVSGGRIAVPISMPHSEAGGLSLATTEPASSSSFAGSTFTSSVIAPQVTIDTEGNIVMAKDSLVVTTTTVAPDAKVVGEAIKETGVMSTYASYLKRSKAERWTPQETARFFEVLSMVGTDFSLVNQFFPDRDRRQIRNKYKREERENRARVDYALRNRKPLTLAIDMHGTGEAELLPLPRPQAVAAAASSAASPSRSNNNDDTKSPRRGAKVHMSGLPDIEAGEDERQFLEQLFQRMDESEAEQANGSSSSRTPSGAITAPAAMRVANEDDNEDDDDHTAAAAAPTRALRQAKSKAQPTASMLGFGTGGRSTAIAVPGQSDAASGGAAARPSLAHRNDDFAPEDELVHARLQHGSDNEDDADGNDGDDF